MVQNDKLVIDRNARGKEFGDRVDDSARRHVATRVVFATNDQAARMMAAGLHKQVVQNSKIIMVAGQTCAAFTNGIGEVNRIISAR